MAEFKKITYHIEKNDFDHFLQKTYHTFKLIEHQKYQQELSNRAVYFLHIHQAILDKICHSELSIWEQFKLICGFLESIVNDNLNSEVRSEITTLLAIAKKIYNYSEHPRRYSYHTHYLIYSQSPALNDNVRYLIEAFYKFANLNSVKDFVDSQVHTLKKKKEEILSDNSQDSLILQAQQIAAIIDKDMNSNTPLGIILQRHQILSTTQKLCRNPYDNHLQDSYSELTKEVKSCNLSFKQKLAGGMIIFLGAALLVTGIVFSLGILVPVLPTIAASVYALWSTIAGGLACMGAGAAFLFKGSDMVTEMRDDKPLKHHTNQFFHTLTKETPQHLNEEKTPLMYGI